MNEAEISNASKTKIVKYIYDYSKSFGWKKSDIESLDLQDLGLLARLIYKKEI